ncbi:hypothetical protein TSAR_004651 [Trichomalopsis sarcophagae]|uniref:Dehydrogenase n=1 Tax=Trichomalopsis sarcophagae TaxID=543379 RepID=A0A232EM06_9HYME|nr:hypothetical protein TSAR_004651 [Trichomalopsis sarcophagae]
MDRWRDKVAVVTGASAGIGLAISKALVQQGLIVVGLARRKAKMEDAMQDASGPGQFHAKECDITKEQNVIEALNWVKSTLGAVNILINNAGVVNHQKIEETPTPELEHIINVNLLGLLYCSKEAIKLMKENQQEAHIININSVLGHMVPPPGLVSFSIYPATKFAVTALSEILKNELIGSNIRVTVRKCIKFCVMPGSSVPEKNVSPGLVKTEMVVAAINKNSMFSKMPALEPEDVAFSIVHALTVPPHVEINEITIQAKQGPLLP